MNQTWIKKTIAALVSVGVLSFSGAGIAFAADAVDQEHVTAANPTHWDKLCLYGGKVAQTFTAGVTTALTRVSVKVTKGKVNGNQSTPVTAEIHTVNDGEPTNTVLGSGTIVVPGGYAGWIDISVGSVSITKGTVYALFLSRSDCQSIKDDGVAWNYDWDNSDDGTGLAYPGGSAWYWDSSSGHYETWQEQDYLFRTYVSHQLSSNANLYRVVVSTGSEDISLWGVNGPMNTSVPNNVEAITVTPELANGAAKATVNGKPVEHKGQITIPLAVGNNVIAISVTAESGNTRVHYVTVRRAVGNNADLKGIVVQGHTLSGSFDAKTTDYTVQVGSDAKELTLGAVTADRSATVTINGTTANIGAAVTTITLADGKNIVTFDVTAQDGVTHKVYTLVIVRGDAK